MKVLFIGGTGIISTAVSQLAIDNGIDLYLFNRGSNSEFLPNGASVIAGDINDFENAKSLLDEHEFDVVVDWIAFTPSDIERDIKLFKDKTPITVLNFVNLSKRGFYNKQSFHRVINDFMIQGGCPLGTGTGGPGYQFEDEFCDELRHDKKGVLSMANAGPGTNGSQFFITHLETPWLDNKHTVFGEVIDEEDMKVVNSIVQNDKIIEIKIEGDFSDIMEDNKDRVEKWNSILSK